MFLAIVYKMSLVKVRGEKKLNFTISRRSYGHIYSFETKVSLYGNTMKFHGLEMSYLYSKY